MENNIQVVAGASCAVNFLGEPNEMDKSSTSKPAMDGGSTGGVGQGLRGGHFSGRRASFQSRPVRFGIVRIGERDTSRAATAAAGTSSKVLAPQRYLGGVKNCPATHAAVNLLEAGAQLNFAAGPLEILLEECGGNVSSAYPLP